MDGIAFLVAAATFVMVLVALGKISKLETRIAQLKLELSGAIAELAKLRTAPAVSAAAAPMAERTAAAVEDMGEAVAAEVLPAEIPSAPVEVEQLQPAAAELPSAAESPPPVAIAKPRRPTRDVEQALASRWFVWIGGLAIAIGGVLFVKYAYDNNLIPPALQIILGLFAGAALVAAGELLRRKSGHGMEQTYVPAALSAGGLVTAFGSIYAAYALYELIAPTTAFIGLAIVGLAALSLSRLQGPLIAALGLLGSYGTPMLIPSEHPSAWSFFPYLLVIQAASFATLRGRNWWWLGYAAIAGSTIWAALWILGPFTASDIWPVGLFAHLIGLVAFFGLAGRRMLRDDEALQQPLAIGLVGLGAETGLLMLLAYQSIHDGVALALFFAAMAVLAAIGWLRPRIDFLAALAAGLSLVVLMAWQEVALHTFAMDESGMWSSVIGGAAPQFLRWMLAAGAAFAILGSLGARLKPKPMLWGGIGGASAILFVFGAWARVDLLMSATAWVAIAGAVAAALLAVAYMGRARHDADPPSAIASGALSAGAALLLLFAADRLFDGIWLTLAIAVLALAFAVAAGVMRLSWQGVIAAGFGSLMTIRLFVSRQLWADEPAALPLGPHWLLYGYGVPAILFLVGGRFLKAAGYLRSAVSLEGLSLGLVISLASLEIRVLIGGGVSAPHPGLLEMAAHILTWLGAAYGLIYRQRLYSSFIAAWGARALLVLSVLAIIGLSLLGLNPVLSGEHVEGGAFFNALLLAYLAPAVLLWLIARRINVLGPEMLRPPIETLAVVLVAAYLSLELKRLGQGPLLHIEPKNELEAALHVILWLGLAVLLVYRGGFLSVKGVEWSDRGLIAASVLAILFSSLGFYNPVVSGQPLLGGTVINSLPLLYLAPIGFIALLVVRLDDLRLRRLAAPAGGLALLLVFAYVTLETKRVFQGPSMVLESQSIAESYAYSAVWLVLALALFGAGIRLGKQYVRYAGLGVMVLVVVKVFLLDMSSLEGLYRIASFVGLGFCLVGIGWLYQRFVHNPEPVKS